MVRGCTYVHGTAYRVYGARSIQTQSTYAHSERVHGAISGMELERTRWNLIRLRVTSLESSLPFKQEHLVCIGVK